MKINRLTFSYKNQKIFHDFSTNFPDPISIIKGPSGGGKTTLLKLICNFFVNENDKNSIEFKSNELKSVLILQEDALLPWLTGYENIKKFIPKISQLEDHQLYHHIKPFIGKRAYEMSFGQRRIIELFRATLFKADVLCLDEPLNFLDSSLRQAVNNLIEESAKEGIKIIMTSHYTEDFINLNASVYKISGLFPISTLERIQ